MFWLTDLNIYAFQQKEFGITHTINSSYIQGYERLRLSFFFPHPNWAFVIPKVNQSKNKKASKVKTSEGKKKKSFLALIPAGGPMTCSTITPQK